MIFFRRIDELNGLALRFFAKQVQVWTNLGDFRYPFELVKSIEFDRISPTTIYVAVELVPLVPSHC